MNNDESIIPTKIKSGHCAGCGGLTDRVCLQCSLAGPSYTYVCTALVCRNLHADEQKHQAVLVLPPESH